MHFRQPVATSCAEVGDGTFETVRGRQGAEGCRDTSGHRSRAQDGMAVESRFGLPTPGGTATPDVEQHAQDEGG
ncbi:MAG: hypothetical protein ACOX8C_06175, partial [Saccharomonospora viridis]|uniref:hypothetical protein n=1 Tax=Saccharomonospora viridis TaxID=1852 RepID=UPI003D91106E